MQSGEVFHLPKDTNWFRDPSDRIISGVWFLIAISSPDNEVYGLVHEKSPWVFLVEHQGIAKLQGTITDEGLAFQKKSESPLPLHMCEFRYIQDIERSSRPAFGTLCLVDHTPPDHKLGAPSNR